MGVWAPRDLSHVQRDRTRTTSDIATKEKEEMSVTMCRHSIQIEIPGIVTECQLDNGHSGDHHQSEEMKGSTGPRTVSIYWTQLERDRML